MHMADGDSSRGRLGKLFSRRHSDVSFPAVHAAHSVHAAPPSAGASSKGHLLRRLSLSLRTKAALPSGTLRPGAKSLLSPTQEQPPDESSVPASNGVLPAEQSSPTAPPHTSRTGAQYHDRFRLPPVPPELEPDRHLLPLHDIDDKPPPNLLPAPKPGPDTDQIGVAFTPPTSATKLDHAHATPSITGINFPYHHLGSGRRSYLTSTECWEPSNVPTPATDLSGPPSRALEKASGELASGDAVQSSNGVEQVRSAESDSEDVPTSEVHQNDSVEDAKQSGTDTCLERNTVMRSASPMKLSETAAEPMTTSEFTPNVKPAVAESQPAEPRDSTHAFSGAGSVLGVHVGSEHDSDSDSDASSKLPLAVRNQLFRGKAKVFEATRVRLEHGTAVLEREPLNSAPGSGSGSTILTRETIPLPHRTSRPASHLSQLSHSSHPSYAKPASARASRHPASGLGYNLGSGLGSDLGSDPAGSGSCPGSALGQKNYSPVYKHKSSGSVVSASSGKPDPVTGQKGETGQLSPHDMAVLDAMAWDTLALDPVLSKALRGGFQAKVDPPSRANSKLSSARRHTIQHSSASNQSRPATLANQPTHPSRTRRTSHASSASATELKEILHLSPTAQEIALHAPLRAKVDLSSILLCPSRHAKGHRLSAFPSSDTMDQANSMGVPALRPGGIGVTNVGVGARLAMPSLIPLASVRARTQSTLISPKEGTRPRLRPASSAHFPHVAWDGDSGSKPAVAAGATSATVSIQTAPPVLALESMRVPPSTIDLVHNREPAEEDRWSEDLATRRLSCQTQDGPPGSGAAPGKA